MKIKWSNYDNDNNKDKAIKINIISVISYIIVKLIGHWYHRLDYQEL